MREETREEDEQANNGGFAQGGEYGRAGNEHEAAVHVQGLQRGFFSFSKNFFGSYWLYEHDEC